MTTTTVVNAPRSEVVVFGTLLDLTLLRASAVQAEVCNACSTINLGAPRFCKGCHHKLPAYYRAGLEKATTTELNPLLARHLWARNWDLVAFWLVINSLAGATALMPRVMA